MEQKSGERSIFPVNGQFFVKRQVFKVFKLRKMRYNRGCVPAKQMRDGFGRHANFRMERGLDMNNIRHYWDTVYIWHLVFAPLACLSAGIYYTCARYFGYYSDVPWWLVCTFLGSQLLYLIIAGVLIYIRRKNRMEKEQYIGIVKWYITIMLLIQYVFVMFPFAAVHTWGCTFLFLIFILFLFDFKFMTGNILGYALIILAAHILYGDKHLAGNEMYEVLLFRVAIFIDYGVAAIFISYYQEQFFKRIQMEQEKEDLQKSQQLAYYQNLDLMDKELRRFRHDIKNHFLCLEELFLKDQLPELKEYFANLVETYSETEQVYFSGNVIVDAILNYDMAHMLGSNVRPVVYGRLPDISTVSSMDLCTVFSNMLSNAIKGSNRIGRENELVIQFQGGDRYFSILVTNELGEGGEDKKADDRNHGYGIQNIQEAADKYQGIFEQKEENGRFAMQVYLPI